MDLEKFLKQMEAEKVSIAELEEHFSAYILGHTRPTMKLCFEKLFRVRNITNKNIEDINTTSEIWYPDWSKIDKKHHAYNRCSDKGQNFFYASNYLEATIREIDPNHNDLLLIGTFAMKFNDVPVQSQFAGINHLKKNGRHKLLLEYEFLNQRDEKIEDEIGKIFRERVGKDNMERYKPSIAFSNILLKNHNIECLVYPSVASNLKFENYGLKPRFVDNYMFCEQIHIYRVLRTNKEIILIPENYGQIIINRNNPRLSTIQWIENDETQKQVIKYSI